MTRSIEDVRSHGFAASKQRLTYTGYFGALASSGLLLALTACSPATPPAPPPPPPPPPAEHVPPPIQEKAPTTPTDLGVRILSDVGFATPESVAHDAAQDVYFVSNINGAPLDVDGNGFISKVTPAGEVQAKFIAGGVDGVVLNAPKGLVVVSGKIHVVDIDRVRTFDSTTGAPEGEIVIKGATFLNDIAAAPDGSFYVSDSGLNKDFSSNGSDAIYKIEGGKVRKLLASKKLGGPNGVLAATGGTWVTTFGSGELYWVSDTGKQEHIQKLPKGANDGIVLTTDGRTLVSSWEGSSVFVGETGKDFVEEISGVESPADIGYDAKRNRLLIPLFKKDSVVLQTLDAADGADEAKPAETKPAAKP